MPPVLKPIGVTFGGKPCYGPAANYFALEFGTAPSRGIFTMLASDAEALSPENTSYDAIFTDERGKAITITGLYIERTEIAPGGAGFGAGAPNFVQVVVHDDRWFGKSETIAGSRNQFLEDQVSYDPRTVKSGVPFTYDELLQECFDELGWDVQAGTGIDWSPKVDWEWSNAAGALQGLLDQIPYDVVRQIDGAYDLVKLADPPENFEPSDQGSVVSDVQKTVDRAHKRPESVKLAFRILRQKEITMTAVMQHDGEDGSGDATPTNKAGEWFPVNTVMGVWNKSAAWAQRAFYLAKNNRVPKTVARQLGPGELGSRRLRTMVSQFYRYFRVNDSDRDEVVPLVPIRAEVGTQTGRETYLGVLAANDIQYHTLARVAAGMKDPVRGTPVAGVLRTQTGRPPWPVRIVDPREGVIEFRSTRPITAAVRRLNGGLQEQDFECIAHTVKVSVAYWKKPVTVTTSKTAYHTKEVSSTGPNNGRTQTFLITAPYAREVFTGGSFSLVNQTEIEDYATKFATEWLKQFDVPSPREVRIEGIGEQDALGADVYSIVWEGTTNGLSTVYRLYDENPWRSTSRPTADRSREFTLKAEQRTLVAADVPEAFISGGGLGLDLGSLTVERPIFKDHETGQRAPSEGYPDPQGGFVNQTMALLLVAQDFSQGPSGEDPCEGKGQETGGGGQRTGSPKGGGGGGPVISGGPADKA